MAAITSSAVNQETAGCGPALSEVVRRQCSQFRVGSIKPRSVFHRAILINPRGFGTKEQVFASMDRNPSRSVKTLIDRFRNSKAIFASLLICIDAILVTLIILYVPYTKIDWDAYMSQVDGFLSGERDYSQLKGDTGPLVYPAGFLYVYSLIKFVTGGLVFPAQILFGVMYIINLALVQFIYLKTDVIPWWAFVLLSLSKRVHSVFVLRLFNDCFAMIFLHASMALLLYQKWYLALLLFSGAVSIKMNVLLFAPPLLLLMLKGLSFKGVFLALLGAGLLQICVGLPFLTSYPVEYISRAFNLGRVFIHFWSVNFKFVPEKVFISKEFASALLFLHLTTLLVFAHYKWSKYEGGLICLLHTWLKDTASKLLSFQVFSCKSRLKTINKEHIATVMFVGNFIGIVFARSLHYQFYSWYFYSLPFLLWKTTFPTFIRLILFAGVEICWNIYPSTFYSSLILLCIHLIILWGLWMAPVEPSYVEEEKSHSKEN